MELLSTEKLCEPCDLSLRELFQVSLGLQFFLIQSLKYKDWLGGNSLPADHFKINNKNDNPKRFILLSA